MKKRKLPERPPLRRIGIKWVDIKTLLGTLGEGCILVFIVAAILFVIYMSLR